MHSSVTVGDAIGNYLLLIANSLFIGLASHTRNIKCAPPLWDFSQQCYF